jgi:hypothetical protein
MTSAPKAEERPFDNDVRPFGREFEQKREADGEVEKPPQHIDHGRGFADARRGRERGLKPVAADPLHEMRDAIRQKQSGDEL